MKEPKIEIISRLIQVAKITTENGIFYAEMGDIRPYNELPEAFKPFIKEDIKEDE